MSLTIVNPCQSTHTHDGIIQNQDQPLSVPLAQQDITDDTSSTSIHALDQDIDSADNNNDVKESQPIDINSINLNNHASNYLYCESPSGSDNIAIRVRARNEKARKEESSQVTRNHNILRLSESRQHVFF